MFKTSPENATDVNIMSELLRVLPIGGTLSYTDVSAAIGRDVRKHYWLLRSAMERVEKESGSLLAVVRSIGVKRLASEELSGVGADAIRKVRRTARRGYNRLDTIRTNDLPQSEATKIVAHKSQLGAITLVADGRKTSTVAAEVAKTGNAIPAGRVLDMFKE
jgi:hypothetical protein